MKVQIKDIYAGKPDAKDEIDSDGIAPFLENYVMPTNFDLNSLISGSHCFITGYKGTGKTALLYYIDTYIKSLDESTCSSFIFFKGDYSDLKKQEIEKLSKRLLSGISIGNDVILDGHDYEYIWRWLFYQRIIEDNEEFNYGVFKKDNNWDLFEKMVNQISNEKKKKLLTIPEKIIISMPFVDMKQQTKIEPTAELNFSALRSQEEKNYRYFVGIIEEADKLFKQLERTDIPYFIFVDELEAYYGEEQIFKRDLTLIRDLIFTVKKFNSVFSQNTRFNTKIICSIRTEILNSINRFIVTKELNKVTSGYEIPIIWDYTNTNSFSHPILKILIKRIEYAEKNENIYNSERCLIENWFPEKINDNQPSNYLLNNSWCKPRDMVRLILAAQNCLGSSNTSFSQATIDFCRKKYSMDSLTEIKEEMRALYSPEDIDNIFRALNGFRAVFSLPELKDHIDKYSESKILKVKLNTVLEDLYRLGIIGNYSPRSKNHRWQHKGDDGLILSDEWSMMIHRALQNALSVNNVHDRANRVKNDNTFKEGEIILAKVNRIVPNFALAIFTVEETAYYGCIHISEISEHFVENVEDIVSIGCEYPAKILNYDRNHKNWRLTLKI